MFVKGGSLIDIHLLRDTAGGIIRELPTESSTDGARHLMPEYREKGSQRSGSMLYAARIIPFNRS